MQTEFVRSLNCNYERILLEEKPEEKRYQYCILNRGGIRGLLSCSLRYINGTAYLYYNISSKQNIRQLYGGRCITRAWITDFIWSFRQIERELGRFLLDRKNILLYPEQIYQDLESNVFSFLYFPYYEGESGFKELLEFWVEQIDYNDEALTACIYQMYEQYERNGDVYLQTKIFEDAERLENADRQENAEIGGNTETAVNFAGAGNLKKAADTAGGAGRPAGSVGVRGSEETPVVNAEAETETDRKRHFFGMFMSKKKERELRENYRRNMQESMQGYAVAEETVYGEEYGKTIYMEGSGEQAKTGREVCTPEGRTLAVIDRPVTTIGKRKEEADIVLEDVSVSRLHARIVKEKEKYYIEDLNSTNGTFKNGLRLQPYERRELEPEDEIKTGRVIMVFR
ncbi:MAG: FHA domain-containing protein [Butyrivibrio sp.]|nr:FHA domain-containing protein [Acetatifactor muris]MCM1559507.1 FHA domain-containing protein [Butyrivibrio sp.]